jgi:hypothetical protein
VTLVVLIASSLFPSGVDASRAQLTGTAQTATLVYDQNFPDPTVLVVDHTYYAYSTNSDGENVPVIESNDLTHWKPIGDAMSILPSWATAGYVWSPSVTVAPSGGYELFFSAFDEAEGVHCLGRATSSSPLGPFVDISDEPFLCQASAGGSIDPSVVRFGGVDYLVWKSDGEGGQPQTILSARLSADDTELVGPTRHCFRQTRAGRMGLWRVQRSLRYQGFSTCSSVAISGPQRSTPWRRRPARRRRVPAPLPVSKKFRFHRILRLELVVQASS